MDRYMGSVTNELATVTGLELTVAPRRPAHATHRRAPPVAAHVTRSCVPRAQS